jgi:hypothetical protein
MRADNSNIMSLSNLEEFARMIFDHNRNLACEKLRSYGLEAEVKDYPKAEMIPLKEKSADVLLGVSEGNCKVFSENIRKPVLKNPFKQKLKIQMGL